jgi:hypothetical protein
MTDPAKVFKVSCSSCGQALDLVPGETTGSVKMPEHNAPCGLPCGHRDGVAEYHGMATPQDKVMPRKITTWCTRCSYVTIVDLDVENRGRPS